MISRESVAQSQNHVIKKKRKNLAAHIVLGGQEGYVPQKRLHAMGVESAESNLEYVRRKQCFATRIRWNMSHWVSPKTGRIKAYMACWMIAYHIWRNHLPLINGRSLLFLCGTGLGRIIRNWFSRHWDWFQLWQHLRWRFLYRIWLLLRAPKNTSKAVYVFEYFQPESRYF